MNTLFNVMNVSPQRTTFSEMYIYFHPILKSGISAADSNLALLMQDIAVNFFPWKDTKTNLQKIMPWISAGFNAAFSFIPESFLERYLTKALVGTIQEFSSGVLSSYRTCQQAFQLRTLFHGSNMAIMIHMARASCELFSIPHWFLCTISHRYQWLYRTRKIYSWKWSLCSSNGGILFKAADLKIGEGATAVSWVCWVTGKIKHVECGFDIVKRLINLNRKNTKTFVICSNSSSSPCGESSLHLESGRMCCLYR